MTGAESLLLVTLGGNLGSLDSDHAWIGTAHDAAVRPYLSGDRYGSIRDKLQLKMSLIMDEVWNNREPPKC